MHSIRFGTFTFLVQTRSMWIECAFNANSVPSADVPLNQVKGINNLDCRFSSNDS